MVKQEPLEEFWVVIDLLSNYEVSNYGRVVNVKTQRELKATPNGKGYPQVKLYHNGLFYSVYIHRLVAAAFFVDYEEGVEVKHLNGNLQDNGVLNLSIGPNSVRQRDDRRIDSTTAMMDAYYN
jgi:hypothetical protein